MRWGRIVNFHGGKLHDEDSLMSNVPIRKASASMRSLLFFSTYLASMKLISRNPYHCMHRLAKF